MRGSLAYFAHHRSAGHGNGHGQVSGARLPVFGRPEETGLFVPARAPGESTRPRLKPVGFSVPRPQPAVAGLTRSPRAFGWWPNLVPVCPTVRTVPPVSRPSGQDQSRAWFSPRPRSLFLARFSAGKGVLPATGQTFSCQRAVPEGTIGGLPAFVGWLKTERLHPTPHRCGLSAGSPVTSADRDGGGRGLRDHGTDRGIQADRGRTVTVRVRVDGAWPVAVACKICLDPPREP